MSAEQVDDMLREVSGWRFVNGHIEKSYSFKNYYHTISFVNAVAWLANREGHHPNLEVGFRDCTVKYWTHAIDGLSENDFICAAKIDGLMGT